MSNLNFKRFNSVEEMKQTKANPGDYAIVDNKAYIYTGPSIGWKSWEPSGEQIEVGQNAYSMAKAIAAQASVLTEGQIDGKKRLIKTYLQNHTNKYFMLLVKDISYYTLFVVNNDSDENISDVIIECLSNIGGIIDIDNDDTGAIEVWVKDPEGEAHIGYLFPYDEGVIECRLS